jgi:ribosome-associated heat shock protein Hsp15
VERVRVDRWLWAARFFKTRSLATDAVLGGHVQVNGERVKPSRDVKAGDSLRIRNGQVEWTVTVRGLSDRRGPAAVARELYEESPESAEARERRRLELRLARPPGADLAGRPTKRDRRRLEALRRGAKRPFSGNS